MQTQLPKNRLRLSALAVLVLASVGPAEAGCMGDWDLSGQWIFEQSNGYSVAFVIEQSGDRLSGAGNYVVPGATNFFSGHILDTNYLGTISGSISGNSFGFLAKWYNGTTGEYVGVIDSLGNIAGTTFDRNSPSNQASWHVRPELGASATAGCIVVETTTPPSSAPEVETQIGSVFMPELVLVPDAQLPPQEPSAPAGYAITCTGGGNMTAQASSDGFLRILFDAAAQGSAAAAPQPGQCAWADRGFRPGEPQMLVYGVSATGADLLALAANQGIPFQVHAYNNNQGAMVVTGLDWIGSP